MTIASPSRSVLFATLLLAGGIPFAPGAEAVHGGPSTVLVNLHTAASHGCSPDVWTQPDLSARVWKDLQVYAETYKAQDTADANWRALLEIPASVLPATFAIEVREAEPGGLFLTGTSWITCDVDPGPGSWLNVTVSSEGIDFAGRGDGALAASVRGHAARASAPHPRAVAPTLVRATPDALELEWPPAGAGEVIERQAVELRHRAPHAVAPDARRATLTGLTENVAYDVRVVRDQGSWTVAGPWTSFRTENLPPAKPTLTATSGKDAIDVSWHVEAHDLARVEIHLGDAPGFTPDASTLRKTASAPFGRTGSERIEAPADRTWYVAGVAIDDRGASSASEVEVKPPATSPAEPSPDAATGSPTQPTPSPTPAQTPLPRPAAPNVTVEAGAARVTWTASPDPRVASYEILLLEPEAEPRVVATATAKGPHVAHLRGLPAGRDLAVRLRALAPGILPAESEETTFALPPEGNLAPTARINLSARAVAVGEEFEANGLRSTDPEGSELVLTWHWGDGTPPEEGASRIHAYERPGTYSVRLVARDAQGATHEAVASIVVGAPAGGRPVASLALSRTSVAAGREIVADASGSYATDGGPLAFSYDWGDGTPPVTAGPTATHAYAAPGAYRVRVTVTTLEGEAAAVSHAVIVEPPGPLVPVLWLSTQRPTAGLTVLADATASGGEEGDALRYRIDWGDGNVSEAPKAWHAYAQPGPYVVRLTLTDATGRQATQAREMLVTPTDAAPDPAEPGGAGATAAARKDAPREEKEVPLGALAALAAGAVAARALRRSRP